MDKLHNIESVTFSGATMFLRVDGGEYKIDLAKQSERLANASQNQRENIEVSPSGYGIHWPDLDEDLSIDGLIGVKHTSPLTEMQELGGRES
ncbi:MAG: DUF2442 domain-containing protein [Planctomycetota bacterium]|jgi:hypothetical protein